MPEGIKQMSECLYTWVWSGVSRHQHAFGGLWVYSTHRRCLSHDLALLTGC